MSLKEEIMAELEPMFLEAEEKGLWFHAYYQDIWLSPKELREANCEGRYIWGKCNWELKKPQERIEQLNEQLNNITEKILVEIESVKQRI